MIKLSNISKSYGDELLFDNLSLTIESNENIAIIGPSGCGKSTLLRFLLGIVIPDNGNIVIDGVSLSDISKSELLELRLNMGMLFQSAALFDSLSIYENIAFPLVENFGYTLSSAKKKVEEMLELVDLKGFGSKRPYQLSGGQKKRVGLARAVITNPKYILYDEPTTGLDPVMSNSIEDLIVNLNKTLNICSIVVSHQKSTILRTADKIYMVHSSALLSPESPETILESSNDIIVNFMKGKKIDDK